MDYDMFIKSILMNSNITEEEFNHFRILNKVQENKCKNFCTQESFTNVLNFYNQHIHGYLSLSICIFGLANIFNIIVLTRKHMRKNAINAILLAISVFDLLVILEYLPFNIRNSIMQQIEAYYDYSTAILILFHVNFSLVFHTITIMLTLTLAIFRYLAIIHPQKKLTNFVQTKYKKVIFFDIIFSFCLCYSNFLLFYIKEKYVKENQKVRILYVVDLKYDDRTVLYKINFWVHSVIVKLLPCCLLTLIILVLINVLCQTNKRKIKLKGYNKTSNSHRLSKIERHSERTTALLVAILILFLLTEVPQGVLGLLSGIFGNCFLKNCYHVLGNLMDLLALINAACVFILYGAMSKQFRSTFRSIFCKKNNQPRNEFNLTKITHLHTSCV